MIEVGTLIRVLYPDYAAGLEGIVEAKENSGRWIVKLKSHSLTDKKEPLWLSLEESDFEVLQHSSSQKLG